MINMNFEQIHEFLNSLQGAELTHPFNETTDVYKVMDKMFALFFVKEVIINEVPQGQSIHIIL